MRGVEGMGEVEEKNRELARTFLEVLSTADVEKARDLYAEDFQLWTAGSLPFSGMSDKQQALVGMEQVLGLFPDGITFTIHAMTAEGERVAIEATSRGMTFRGDLYEQTYHFLLRARDGKIVEFKEYMDTELARKILVGE
jgi:ketosteroid isomerase-like protein